MILKIRNLITVYILVLFTLQAHLLYGQSDEIEKLFDQFEKVNSTLKKREIVNKIITKICEEDTTTAQFHTKKLLKLTTNSDDPYIYIQSLTFYSRYGSLLERIDRLYRTINLAEEYGDKYLIARAWDLMSELYNEKGLYDSTIYAILKSYKIYKELKYYNEEANLLHKIGDLFYRAKLYDKAEYYYKQVEKIKGDPKAWREWRKFVITNNFGLIEEGKGNLDKAYNYFLKALNNLIAERNFAFIYDDSVRLAYSYKTLANVCINKKDLTQALNFINKLITINNALKSETIAKDLDFLLGKLNFYNGNYDLALNYLNKLKMSNKKSDNSGYPIEVDNYLAKIYEAKKDYKNAFLLNQAFYAKRDSLINKQNTLAAILLLADFRLNESYETIKILETRQIIYLLLITITVLSLITVIFLYTKYRNTTQRLIKSILENVKPKDQQVSGLEFYNIKERVEFEKNYESINKLDDKLSKDNISNQISDFEESEKVKKIIKKIEDVVINKELYLDSRISLDSLAAELNTNRNILSKVINTHYGVSFNTFINDLRIKKAINIISKKESLDLYTLEAIASKVGFSNRTTFISAFKNYTGMTPSTFIKNLKAINENNIYKSIAQ